MKPEIEKKIQQLDEKYQAMGQDLASYLDGLLYADYLTYWDYIHLDTLMSLQSPKTSFPDEMVFIMYHQITELYFKLSLHEFEQLHGAEKVDGAFLKERVRRVVRYFDALTDSFEIMVDGMDPAQFLKFRMSLLPASGFQSAQYRLIEISGTDLINLVDKDFREELRGKAASGADMIPEMIENLYWKKGATELSSGKKTLTLQQFEQKYMTRFLEHAYKFRERNVAEVFRNLSPEEQKDETLRELLRKLDAHVNVKWPLSHYKSAVRYLQKDPEDIAATGGTNWQKYLPPRFQKRIFYPELWSSEELENWGKGWVKREVFGIRGSGDQP